MSGEERDQYYASLDKYYMSGTWYGQSAAGIVYLLATALERVDNDLLWYAPCVLSPLCFVMLTDQGSRSLALRISMPVVEFHVWSMRNFIPSTTTKFLVSTLHRLRTMSTAWPH